MIRIFFSWLFWLLFLPFRLFWLGLVTVIMATALGEFFAADPEDIPITDTLQKVVSEPKDAFASTMSHLNEFRKHLIRSVVALIITSSAAFFYFEEIITWLVVPIGGIEKLEAKEVTETIRVYMRVGFLVGLSISSPYILFEFMRFIVPGIKRKARIMGLLIIPFSTLFFGVGIWFAYKYMLPSAITFLLNFSEFNTVPTAMDYIRFTTGFMFGSGLAFQLPLVSYALAAMRVMPARLLKDNWRIAFVLLAFLAAMITPTPDWYTMLIVLLPLWILYGLSIIMAYIGQGSSLRRKST